MAASAGLLLLLTGVAIYAHLKRSRQENLMRFEKVKNRELQKRLKLALETIGKMEQNPDLIHSREFNLDYLRMRMDEEIFHYIIVNQIKVKIRSKIATALRPHQADEGRIGIASIARQVDEMFDIEYQVGTRSQSVKQVLFRVRIRLTKIPIQPTLETVAQVVACIETFLSPTDKQDHWQSTIQGQIVQMRWDQKARPTPLLIVEQSTEGANVPLRTARSFAHS